MNAKQVKRIMVAGASRGIGLAVARARAAAGDEVISVSRKPSPIGHWIEADLGSAIGCQKAADAVGGARLDALLYMGGTWETDAFTEAFEFEKCSDDDLRRVLDVNLLAPIRLAQRLLPALRRSPAPRIVFMGALSGLPHRASPEVANTASKFGLQGVAQALVEATRGQGVGVTVINPGNVATPEVVTELAQGQLLGGSAIEMADLLACIDLVLRVGAATTVERIDVTTMLTSSSAMPAG
jgi:3-oxoacyl-[acyl-carrier protein] reductase